MRKGNEAFGIKERDKPSDGQFPGPQCREGQTDKQTNSEEPKVLPNLWTQGHKIEVCVHKCCVISLKDKV